MMKTGEHENELISGLPFFPSLNRQRERERLARAMDVGSHADGGPQAKQIWTSSDLLQIFNQYKKYGNQWSTIAQGFDGISSQNIKNRFFGLARRALRMMMKLLNRREKNSLTDFVSSIHTKTLILGINQVVRFEGKRREVVMLDVVKKYAFIRNFKPEYVASAEEQAFLEKCIEYFLCLNNVIMGRTRSLKVKRIRKVRNVPFKFYKNDRRVNFRQFLERRRSGFKREDLNQRTVKTVSGFRKVENKLDMSQAEKLKADVDEAEIAKERQAFDAMIASKTRKWSASTDVKSNIVDTEASNKQSPDTQYGVIRFQTGTEFDLLGYFKKSLSRQVTRDYETILSEEASTF